MNLILTTSQLIIGNDTFNFDENQFNDISNLIIKYKNNWEDLKNQIKDYLDKQKDKKIEEIYGENYIKKCKIVYNLLKQYDEDFILKDKILYHNLYKDKVQKRIVKEFYKLITEKNPNPKNYTPSSLINFYHLLMRDPDKHVRKDIFKWFVTGKFSITKNGNIIGYRNVNVIKRDEYGEEISRLYLKNLREKRNLKNIYIIKNQKTNKYDIVEIDDIDKLQLGNIPNLEKLYFERGNQSIYTDEYTGTFKIKMLNEVRCLVKIVIMTLM